MRLRPVPDRWVLPIRILWSICFLLSLATVVLGTIHAVRETYEVQPAFRSLSLDYELEANGLIPIKADARPSAKYRLLAINGKPVAEDIRSPDLAQRLQSESGPNVTLHARAEDGTVTKLQQSRKGLRADDKASRARDMRFAARLASGLLACGVLLLCSLLLALRRPSDPVALLFAFSFTGIAATIDPPLAMWMAYGWPIAYDVISSAWFYLFLIALASFPDGIFVPKVFRWVFVVGIPLAIIVSLRTVGSNVQVIVALGSLLAVLTGQVRRYRRLEPGIERQQIKWVAFGFAAGLLLVGAAFLLLAFVPDESSPLYLVLNMLVVLLFSLGMAVLPLGLLTALTRFRLWEADTIISRSAAYAVVTVVVGIVWAASSDLMKMIIGEVLGRESQAGATTLGAIIATGIFKPTQSVVLGWTERRFGSPVDRIHEAAKRLESWGLTEAPAEVATRALEIIDQAIHPSASAIVLDTAKSHELIAAREAKSQDDPRLTERLTLADDEGSVGTLLLGRRSDGNRYNRLELEAVQEMIPSLARALRVSRSRYSSEKVLQQRLDEMAARLARLEAAEPKPKPA